MIKFVIFHQNGEIQEITEWKADYRKPNCIVWCREADNPEDPWASSYNTEIWKSIHPDEVPATYKTYILLLT